MELAERPTDRAQSDDENEHQDWGEEFNDEAELPDTFTSIPEGFKGKGKGKSKKPGKEGESSVRRWTKEQDDVLRENYPLYQGTHSVYDILALEPELEVCLSSC